MSHIMKKILKGPNGLRIELDTDKTSAIAMVCLARSGGELGSATFSDATSKGMIYRYTDGSEIRLNDKQCDWLNRQDQIIDQFLFKSTTI